jgi:Rrf2 family protein
MISQTGRYVLRILGYLVGQPDEWILGKDIAAATGIPANYLSKILSQLRRHGFVVSQKGWGGGFQIRAKVLKTSIADVLTFFDGPARDTECLFGLPKCDATCPCPLHRHWEKIRKCQADMLLTTKVGDLCSR